MGEQSRLVIHWKPWLSDGERERGRGGGEQSRLVIHWSPWLSGGERERGGGMSNLG